MNTCGSSGWLHATGLARKWDMAGAAVFLGAAAGLLPAIRAARLSPTQALLTV